MSSVITISKFIAKQLMTHSRGLTEKINGLESTDRHRPSSCLTNLTCPFTWAITFFFLVEISFLFCSSLFFLLSLFFIDECAQIFLTETQTSVIMTWAVKNLVRYNKFSCPHFNSEVCHGAFGKQEYATRYAKQNNHDEQHVEKKRKKKKLHNRPRECRVCLSPQSTTTQRDNQPSAKSTWQRTKSKRRRSPSSLFLFRLTPVLLLHIRDFSPEWCVSPDKDSAIEEIWSYRRDVAQGGSGHRSLLTWQPATRRWPPLHVKRRKRDSW